MASNDGVSLAGERSGQPAGPCAMVIFGAAGDLTKRKLIPALYNLAKGGLLPQEFAIVGVARAPMTTEDFRQRMSRDIHEYATEKVEPGLWEWFAERLHYVHGNFEEPNAYPELRKTLQVVDKEHETRGNYFYYLATSPSYFSEVVRRLSDVGLLQEENGRWRRVIIEKPYGCDLESARALNREIGTVLAERQIYRIDHYLGKETVQNILVFRFANGIFEPIWNRR
jgi:glucose-6-phosphate 1-dehydrogenase